MKIFKLGIALTSCCFLINVCFAHTSPSHCYPPRDPCHYHSDYLDKVDPYREEPSFINVVIPQCRSQEKKDEKIYRELIKEKFMVKFHCK